MAVKIILTRKVPEDKAEHFIDLLIRLRSATMGQPGYISGETLRRVDQPGEWVVISKWQSRYDWDQWCQNPQREAVQKEIDTLLGSATEIAVYEYE